jgi:GNAT superfamily N-acetyltransferase
MASIVQVTADGEQLDKVRELFREYARWLGDEHALDREREALPAPYTAPSGWLFLATLGAMAAGCVGVRRLDERRCEIKRLFVRPVFRGAGLGGMLLGQSIERANAAGYHEIVIETLPRMPRARLLCEGMGFELCAPYLPEPTPGADCYLLAL